MPPPCAPPPRWFQPLRPQRCSWFQTIATAAVLLVLNHCDRSGALGFKPLRPQRCSWFQPPRPRRTGGGIYPSSSFLAFSFVKLRAKKYAPPCAPPPRWFQPLRPQRCSWFQTIATAAVLLVLNHCDRSGALGFKPQQPQSN